MPKAFSGLKVVDTTHVLAGPFASYQLSTLGAEVIKVEAPDDPDQARMQGADRRLNDLQLGTAFAAQGANKKALCLDLKAEEGREALKRLVATADVFVENYRPGSFGSLGLGYEELSKLNPGLIYCSISAFGSTGDRREETGYDNVIQAFSGIMAMTGFEDHGPVKCGAPIVDYATGTTAAYAISAALYQRERAGGQGQHIDVSMLDVALVLCSSHVVGYFWNEAHPERKGNRFPFATIGEYRAKDHPIMIGASNLAQQARLWRALGYPNLIKINNNQRLDSFEQEHEVLTKAFAAETADYWESLLKKHRIPVSRIRRLEEALADPQVASRGVFQRLNDANGHFDGLRVPVAAFGMSGSTPEVHSPPQEKGAQTSEILQSLGYSTTEIEGLRGKGVI